MIELGRSKSILRTGGAGQEEKRTNCVHYPRDFQLQTLPPSASNAPRYTGEISSSNGNGPGGGRGNGDGDFGAESGNNESGGSGRVRSLPTEATKIDFENLPDDSTPPSRKSQDRIDFSLVFGEIQVKYNQNEDYEDEGRPDPDIGGKQQGNEQRRKSRSPEERITIFAFRLAIIEKVASGLGTIAFVWATVVILGGFASIVGLTDFLVVTAIILAETMRIFGRSHELEWQHVSSKSSGLGLRSLLNAARSLSGQRSTEDSKHAAKTNPKSSQNVQRALSAPGRLLGKPPKSASPHSPESDLRTTTDSSNGSSRYNRRQVAATLLPTSSAPISRPTNAFEPQGRTLNRSNVPILPFPRGVSTEIVGRVLYFAQILSAGVSIGLSFWRLSSQCFVDNNSDGSSSAPSPVDSGGNTQCSSQANVTVSMNVFYVLAVLEAGLFLLEKLYWEYRISFKKMLGKVCKEDHVGIENVEVVKHFFYDVYAECLKGTVFDGLEMDLVTYSISWLQTEEFEQQLGGARLLNRFVSKGNKFRSNDRFAADALRTLGTTPGIIERLVEMLSWGSKDEEELLLQVATIICRLLVYNRNCARFMAVPGAMDGVVSLLIPPISKSDSKSDDSHAVRSSPENFAPPFALRLTGLRILKCLCKDPKNSRKVGDQRGLLSIVMVFIEVRSGKSSFLPNSETDDAHLKTYKKSLQVVLLLAAATNTSGGILRKRIAAVVSGLKNLRDIIEFGKTRPELQRLSIEILYNLAMEDDVRKTIGATGGVIRNLFKLFRKYKKVQDCSIEGTESPEEKKMREERRLACVKAGETLARVVLQNDKNCMRLLEMKHKRNENNLVTVMVDSLSQVERMAFGAERIACSAAQILRSVLEFADQGTEKEIAAKTATLVVRYIFSRNRASTKSEMYEASLGLAARTLHWWDWKILEEVDKVEFVQHLMRNLQHSPSTNKYPRIPRIRRYSVELIIALIQKEDNSFLDVFEKTQLDLRVVLEKTLDSTSEVENFCLFSGLVGYTRHSEEIDHLIERAIAAVKNYRWRRANARYDACYLT